MDWNRRLCIIAYSLVLIQCIITMVVTYIKVKKSDERTMLLIIQILISMWLVFGMYEVQSTNDSEMMFAVRLSLFPICFGSASWFIFALVYAKLISLKNIGIISLIIVPKILLFIPVLTNKYFHLIVISKSYQNPSITNWGTFSEMNFNLGYLYIVLGISIIIFKALKDYKVLKFRIILVILGPTITLATNILSRNKILPDIGIDPTPITFSIFALLLSLGILRFKAFDIIQSATMDVFMDNDEVIMILDDKNRIIEYNSATVDEFGDLIKLESIDYVESFILELKRYSRNVCQLNLILDALNKNEEIIDQYFVIDNPYGKKYYSLILRYVKEAESGKLGSMMKISNRTGHTEGMIKEERNRISGDIHDNLSNMVNVISMNLDYSMKNIDDKKNVLKCIGTAYEASNQIRLHLRRILNELTPVDMKEVGVINAVKSLFRRVEGIGVKIDFSYTDLSDAINYHEDYGMLIYKTCMEGINNALFNGRATKISVLLSCDDEVIKLHISDNGVGCEEIIKGRGLTSMEHRIQSIEGNVVFESVEGEGFWIKAEVPIRLISFVPIPESIE